jgi:hypothetical protein
MPNKKSLSSVQRTLRELRNQGCICEIVEKFNAYAGPFGKRMDCFGFGDILALRPGGISLIQACGTDFTAHERKILESEYPLEWLKSGTCQDCGRVVSRIELWGWRKVKAKRGGKQMVWKPRVKEFTLKDFV